MSDGYDNQKVVACFKSLNDDCKSMLHIESARKRVMANCGFQGESVDIRFFDGIAQVAQVCGPGGMSAVSLRRTARAYLVAAEFIDKYNEMFPVSG